MIATILNKIHNISQKPPLYPASIVTAGLQSVWDLRTSGTGTRGAPNKTLGVDTLPSGAVLSGGALIISSSCTFGDSSGTGDRWNLTSASALFGIVIRGNSTVVTFWDCLFQPQPNDPAVNDPQNYGLQIPDDSTTHPTVTLNYCTFDGGKYQSNVGVGGVWGAALYLLMGSTVTVSHCKFTGMGDDVIKVTNASLTMNNTLVQAYGWNQNSDADGIQQISGSINLNNCIYDISDGALGAVNPFPGQPANSGLFCTVDQTVSTEDGAVSVTNCVFYGYGQYGTAKGTPFNVLSVADNHTDTSPVYYIRNGVWQNIVVEPGNSHNPGDQLGYWTHGGTITSATSIATWTGVIDFNTGATVLAPSF